MCIPVQGSKSVSRPEDCDRVCHENEAQATRGKRDGSKLETNHCDETETVEAEEDGDDARRNPCPTFGTEKTDSRNNGDGTETQRNKTAAYTAATERKPQAQKSHKLDNAKGEANSSDKKPYPSNDTMMIHARATANTLRS
jgi:hypothetical protein